MTETNPNPVSIKRELVLTRIFDARRELVFKAWIDPKQVAQWWGPKEFTNPLCEIDARPGGAIFIQMRAPDGGLFPMWGTFLEIVEPSRLVFTARAFENNEGLYQLETHDTITFAETNGKTELTLHVVVVRATPEVDFALAGMEDGWSGSFEKLARQLFGVKREMV